MALSRAIFQYLGRWPGKSRATIPCQRCPVFQLLMRMKATAKRVRCPVRDSFFFGRGSSSFDRKQSVTNQNELKRRIYRPTNPIILSSIPHTWAHNKLIPQTDPSCKTHRNIKVSKRFAICHPLGTWAAPGIPHRSNLSMEAMKPWETLASAPRRSRYVQGAWDTFWI